MYGNRWRIIQDKAPAHRANSVTEYLETNEIRKVPWPSYSPDLNAIENVWSLMKFQISKLTLLTIEDLEDALIQAWEDIPQETIQAFIDFIPKKIEVILENDGNF